ncbi:MAG: adenylate/guanylate cyclase domain-containing protein [Gammaproteobacteria bacterium]|nr:adenylate/guanylate cyclase domain-containing protein [Gammaproteobacteria bacterium]MDH3859722.1 adenylate/guanylate cyclase domain-containing protein [Gammaproteobacteria bacterium]
MPSEPLNRKLTAILYTDVAGYSRLTGGDEEGTHRQVMEVLDYTSQQISDAGGKVLRYSGDAILAEFSSAVSAVNTAIDIQREMTRKNQQVADDKKVQIRIGINIGDVIEDRGEVFGDGVNLAARLEAAAPEGGICISSSVHEQVLGKLEEDFTDGGEEQFKNINRPVHVYRWVPTQDSSVSSGNPAKRSSEKPSIAVLALTNMSNDPDQDFIGDGITEDLITALSKIRSFKVISRESTFSYKGSAIDVREVARELGVRFVLEGSVRKAGNRVRVTAQLIDAETGHHVWAERYDREMEDIFDLQDEMVRIIASALEPELNAFERERAVSKSPDNLDAWELYQRALWHMWTFEEENIHTALELFKQSSAADPKFAPAYAYYAYCCYQFVILGIAEDPDAYLQEGLESARKALQCDDRDAISYFAIGRIHMMLGDHDSSIAALRKSIELNPCFAQAYHGLGFALSLAGELEESKLTTKQAVTMSPRDPMMWAFTIVHALTYILSQEYETALEWANRTLQIPNATGYWSHAVKASALANLGRVDDAKQSLALALAAKPDLSIGYLEKNLPTKHVGGLDPYLDGLKKCGLE